MNALPTKPLTVRSDYGSPWVIWHSWEEWRFGQKCPEHVWFEPIHQIQVEVTMDVSHKGWRFG